MKRERNLFTKATCALVNRLAFIIIGIVSEKQSIYRLCKFRGVWNVGESSLWNSVANADSHFLFWCRCRCRESSRMSVECFFLHGLLVYKAVSEKNTSLPAIIGMYPFHSILGGPRVMVGEVWKNPDGFCGNFEERPGANPDKNFVFLETAGSSIRTELFFSR